MIYYWPSNKVTRRAMFWLGQFWLGEIAVPRNPVLMEQYMS